MPKKGGKRNAEMNILEEKKLDVEKLEDLRKQREGHSAEIELILALDITDFFDFFTVCSLCSYKIFCKGKIFSRLPNGR